MKRSYIILCLGLLTVYALIFQNARGVWEPSEGRYVCVATEMIRSGDWTYPHLNDDIPHWTKPPLTYWALAASIKLFGYNDFAVRFPSAFAYLLTILLVFYLGGVFVPDRPWMPAFIYATFIFPFISSNIITTDGMLTLFETAGMAGFASAYWRRGSYFLTRYGVLLGWTAFGLAFMTKGPPALLPLLALWLYLFLAVKDKRKIRVFIPGWGLLVFFFVGWGWYIYVIANDRDLFQYFVWDEIAARIFTGQHERNPQWYGAIVIYLPTLLVGTLPWTRAVWREINKMIRGEWHTFRKINTPGDEQGRFLLFWFFIPLVIFFLSKSRLALYVLPLFVPLSIAAARGMASNPFKKWKMAYWMAVWCSLLLTLRGLSSFFPMVSDNRLLADQIKGYTHTRVIKEIVFVEAKPYLGLSLYFNAEVENILIDKPATDKLEDEYLGVELSEYESGRLWVVPQAAKDSFLKIIQKQGFGIKPLGQVKGRTVYELYVDDFYHMLPADSKKEGFFR